MKLNLDMQLVQPETGHFTDLVPAGEYSVVFTNSELVKTKSGHALKLFMKIVEGECENKVISEFLNFDNPSDVAQKISLSRLRRICDLTIQKPVLRDSDELLGHKVKVKVEIEEANGFKNNRVKGYSEASPSSTDKYTNTPSPITESRTKFAWE